jgi:hypothetical protein
VWLLGRFDNREESIDLNNLDDENKLLHRDKLDNKNMFDNIKPPYN